MKAFACEWDRPFIQNSAINENDNEKMENNCEFSARSAETLVYGFASKIEIIEFSINWALFYNLGGNLFLYGMQ